MRKNMIDSVKWRGRMVQKSIWRSHQMWEKWAPHWVPRWSFKLDTSQAYVSLTLLLGSFIVSAPASAEEVPFSPLEPRCSRGVDRDCFGLGMAEALGSNPLQSVCLGPQSDCLQLGIEWGVFLASDESHSSRPSLGGATPAVVGVQCRRDFHVGYRLGLSGETVREGADCVIAGRDAGISVLHQGARFGRVDLVGEACLAAFASGQRDASLKKSAVFTGTNRLAECYFTGYGACVPSALW